MNCSRIEELIPLYIEDDLDREMKELAWSHLKNCLTCSRMVEEYRESQRALRLYGPPDFDDSLFEDLRGAVLNKIEKGRPRPALFQSFSQVFARPRSARFAFAAAIALLIIFGAIAAYIHFDKMDSSTRREQKEIVRQHLEQEESAPPAPEIADETPATESAPPVRRVPNRRRSVRRPPREEIISNDVATAREPEEEPASDTTAAKEPLRIEIQTSDPNIRIIWFASLAGDTALPRPMPSTN